MDKSQQYWTSRGSDNEHLGGPERVIPQNSGSAGNTIVYAAYPGATVTIDGSGITLPADMAGLFEISAKSYITVSALRVINAHPDDNSDAGSSLNAPNTDFDDNSQPQGGGYDIGAFEVTTSSLLWTK